MISLRVDVLAAGGAEYGGLLDRDRLIYNTTR